MPTYQYVCTACAQPLEAQQSFADDPLTECPACGGRLRKVFSAVGVVFKGSGFYRNDSRAAADGVGSGSDGTGGDSATADKGGSTGGSTDGSAGGDGQSGGGSGDKAASSGAAKGSGQQSGKGSANGSGKGSGKSPDGGGARGGTGTTSSSASSGSAA